MRNQTILGMLLAAVAMLAACGDSDSTSGAGASTTTSSGGNGGNGATGGGGTGGGNGGNGGATTNGGNGGGVGGTATTSTGTGAGPLVEIPCQAQVYECGDTLDNDMDGLFDWQDPDCLGVCDNSENGYHANIPGGTGPDCFVDCYWDNDSGPGNDDCFWDHRCDPNEQNGHPEPIPKCEYDPQTNIQSTDKGCADLEMEQSPTCAAVCGPLTPNGCDCFGCCELPAGTGKYVWVGSYLENDAKVGTCTIADVNDPDKCEPCQPVPSCLNECGKCELCIGKGPEDLPPECTPGGSGGGGAGQGGSGGAGQGGSGGGSQQCPAGVQPCGLPGQAPCGASFYCVTGCCQPIEVPN